MPKIISDSTGEEVEMFTAEEIEAQKQEAIEASTGELEALQKERDDKQAEIDNLTKQLEGELDKDKNFAELRKQREDLKKERDELKGKIDSIDGTIEEKVESAKSAILEGVNKDHYSETLKALVGDDEELQKKVELNYSRLTDEVASKEDITKKMTDAYRLSVEDRSPNALNTAVVSSGGAPLARPPASKAFTQEEKELAGKFGLSDEDLKKYGN